MRKVMLGALLGMGMVLLALAAVNSRVAVSADRPGGSISGMGDGGLIALPSAAADHGQHITVIDTKQRSMAVYHVDAASGRIKLMSVRSIGWDLQVTNLNSENPLPQEIRAMLEQR